MAQYTIVFEQMVATGSGKHRVFYPESRWGELIEAADTTEAWKIAHGKASNDIQVADVLPGAVEVESVVSPVGPPLTQEQIDAAATGVVVEGEPTGEAPGEAAHDRG